MNNSKAVLIIEDEVTLRSLLKTLLEDSGIKVYATADGLEAIDVLKSHIDEIKIMVADMGLPQLGGLDAFLVMKKIKPELVGILASGYFNPELREELVQAGACDFIQKPYNSKALVARITEMLNGDN